MHSEYHIDDNVSHFLDQIKEICEDGWEPNFQDFLRIRTRSTGFQMEKMNANIDKYGEYVFEFTDPGGARAERKKWMKIAFGIFLCVSIYWLICFVYKCS